MLMTYGFYAVISWALVVVFAAFRYLAGDSVGRGVGFRLGLLVWLGVPALLAFQGVLLDFSARPPALLRVVGAGAILVVLFAFSPWGKKTAAALPESLLVGGQAFRIPLEVMLFSLAGRGLLPVEMTFAGDNFDIITGLLALPLWWKLRQLTAPRWALYLWNGIGLLLLLGVVTLAILSFPQPFAWFTPENQLVAFFPWVWIPTFLGPLALLGHLLLFRKLSIPLPPRGPNI